MAPLHKMSIDFYEAQFSLIALHTSFEDYTLAYWLNKQLKTKFKRQRKDLDLNTAVSFSVFDWLDIKTDAYWSLVSNKHIGISTQKTEDLFSEVLFEKQQHLVPEHPKVDYFLKIEDEGYINTSKLVVQLKQIPLIVTAFTIDQNQLKSKNNLIF